MPYEFGDVILVPFPYTNQTSTKQRPAVVVSNRSYNRSRPDVVAMAVTSVITPGEVPVGDWQRAGLLKPSIFKPLFATFENSLIRRRLGVLADNDKTVLRKLIHSVLG
jgi:mRNA interferase MazF